MAESERSVPFSRWITQPQSLIALSAVLLSLCGLFIAVYEAGLMRRQQRASVWPHVEVSASITGGLVSLWVQNTGVGPARIRGAALSQNDETLTSWADLIRRAGLDPDDVDSYFSLISDKVLPGSSAHETIFRVKTDAGPAAAAFVTVLGREILEGRVDLELCYCSVYDECWTSRLQDVWRSRRGAAPVGDRSVSDCERAPRSGI